MRFLRRPRTSIRFSRVFVTSELGHGRLSSPVDGTAGLPLAPEMPRAPKQLCLVPIADMGTSLRGQGSRPGRRLQRDHLRRPARRRLAARHPDADPSSTTTSGPMRRLCSSPFACPRPSSIPPSRRAPSGRAWRSRPACRLLSPVADRSRPRSDTTHASVRAIGPSALRPSTIAQRLRDCGERFAAAPLEIFPEKNFQFSAI
jgi:hypothetical protein